MNTAKNTQTLPLLPPSKKLLPRKPKKAAAPAQKAPVAALNLPKSLFASFPKVWDPVQRSTGFVCFLLIGVKEADKLPPTSHHPLGMDWGICKALKEPDARGRDSPQELSRGHFLFFRRVRFGHLPAVYRRLLPRSGPLS